MVDINQFKNQTRGKWLSIFDSCGIEIPENGKHGPCPIESAGKDRFRCDNKDGSGSWFCNNCGSGDGISLVRQCLGLRFPDTIAKISQITGIPDNTQQKQDYDPRESLQKLWNASKPLTGSDPVLKYLHGRGIVLTPNNVRYCPECWESDTKKKYPAMIAKFSGIDGNPVSLHRTYLDGKQKADIKSPKKLMKGMSPLSGGAIRLFPFTGVLGVAEGIETAISAKQLTDIPCWAAVSSTLLKSFSPPGGVKKIVIFGDADANCAGQMAAYSLANRLYNKDFVIDVQFPDIGKDFNDCLREKGK